MSGRLKTLIIEDSADDVELIIRTLEKANFQISPSVVETMEGLQACLTSEKWDLIISDYNMPGFSGMQALEISRKFAESVPFIIVSGAIGEEKAVDLMRAGASDFVSKLNLKRLVPTIQRELRIREKVAVSEKMLDQIFSKSPSFISLVGMPEHRWIKANDAYMNLIGRRNIVGKKVLEVLPEVEAQGFIEVLNQVYLTREPFVGYEMPITLKMENGQSKSCYLDFVYQPLMDIDGKVYAIAALGYDVTEKVVTRNQIQESESRLIDVLNSMSDGFFSVDENWIIQRVNPQHELISRVKAEDQIGRNFLELFLNTLDLQKTKNWNYYHKAMTERVPVRFDDYYAPLNIWSEMRVYPTPDGGLAVFYSDITEVKKSQARLQTVLDTVPIFAGVLNSDGVVTLVNDLAVKAISQSKEDVLGKKVWECAWWSSLDEVVPRIREAVNHASLGVPQRCDIQYIAISNGRPEVRWVDLSMIPVINQFGQLEGITTTGFDITDRVQLGLDLKKSKIEAERANELKSAFLANMSHEIRTPLGAMIGFADLLKEPGVSEEERKTFIDVMIRNGHQLSHLIDDILDLSKVESGHLSIERIAANPVQLVSEVVSLLSVKAKEKSIHLLLNTEVSVPQRILTDPTRLRQILTNVIGNAIKFTPVGKVTVHVFSRNPGEIQFDITDTGVGIEAADVSKLFQVFSQADDSVSRKYGGTGLGLALSKRLAQALGGDVTLKESVKNRGSIFSIVIRSLDEKIESHPFLQADGVMTQASASTPLSGVNILLVEDAPDNRELIWRILSQQGVALDIATNGIEGVEKALSGRPDLVLMDIQMPHMDGFTATQKLRETGFSKPIIALTAHAMNEVRIKCLNVGCSDYLTKPIDSAKLISTLQKHWSQSSGRPSQH